MQTPEEILPISRKSALEMTLEDHVMIHSTPPEILKQNPGKTRADLMTDAEISSYLLDEQGLIDRLSLEENHSNSFAQSALPDRQANFELTRIYLTKIGRLPEEHS
jgi:hypothetical protein